MHMHYNDTPTHIPKYKPCGDLSMSGDLSDE